jgi:hypothetical protein
MRIDTASLQKIGGLAAWASALALSLSVFMITERLAPYSDVSPLVGYFAGFALVVGCVLSVAISVPPERKRCAVLGLIALIALAIVHRGHGVAAAAGVLLALLALGSTLGAWVGMGIEQPSHLLFVAVISSLADAFSVGHPEGPSATIARQPEALALLALPWPMLGTRDIVPFLGVGDVVFTSLYYSAARRHGLALGQTLIGVSVAFIVTAITVWIFERAIPVLPFLGVALLIAHPALRTPSSRDLRRGLWLVTAFVLALAVWVFRRSL